TVFGEMGEAQVPYGATAVTPSIYRFFDADFRFFGTFAPASRASERPIAMACSRLVTRLPERPLFNVPRLRSRLARSTFSPAFFPYLAMHPLHTRGPACLICAARPMHRRE